MEPESEDDRAALVKAYSWAGRVTTVCLEMVVPGGIGYLLDQRLGSGLLCATIGFVIGPILGVWHLLKMASADEAEEESQKRNSAARKSPPGKQEPPSSLDPRF